jgi:asparagine synthase (glutamine-hydrolysing)
MCGIAGLVTPDERLPDEGLLQRLTDDLRHRGPDGGGVWAAPGIGLGHRRLAIIDLSDRAAQPMAAKDGLHVISYNGEVYNYRELRVELAELGATFTSDSDTEVVLNAYRAWGPDCAKRFRGMFAFAIWDAAKKTCVLIRDRIGKKPIFYRTLSDGTVAFSSEIGALAKIEPVTVDDEAIRLFFGLQYVPSPLTGYKELRSLPPGHRAFVSNGEIRVEPYASWDTEDPLFARRPNEGLVELLEEAVRLRLRADVTVGAFLSGGIDSAAIVALATRYASRPLRTFTMGFPSIGMDERPEAEAIATHFHTSHDSLEARPEHLAALTERIIDAYGGPYADSSALPVMLLSEIVAREIKVVLVGDGGDELFGGYRRYKAYAQALTAAKLGGWMAPWFVMFGQIVRDAQIIRMGETLGMAKANPIRAYGELFCGSYFSSRLRGMFQPEFLERTKSSDAVAYVAGRMSTLAGKPLERAMRFDFESYLADDLNVKMDRATMAYGLEARAPFLDARVIAYALKLPLSQRVDMFNTKIALKRAMRGILPDEVLTRPKKGFQVPLAVWFRNELKEYWKERCLAPGAKLHSYVKPEAAKLLFEENERGMNHGNRLWMLLALAVWLEKNQS